MSKLSGIITSVAIAFASTSAMTEEKLDPQNDETHRYSNFITTLKSLCKTHKNILLGDTNHSDPTILRLTADKDVLQTIKDCGATLVLEAGIEENEGYPEPKHEYNHQKIAESILIIQEYLQTIGFKDVEQTGVFDENTSIAFYDFIASSQKKLSWTEDHEGIYSTEFAKILGDNAKNQDLNFLAAAEYLNGYGYFLPVRPTLHMEYQNIQDGYVEYTGSEYLNAPELAENKHAAQLAQLDFDRRYYAAKMNLPLIYPDPRHQEWAKDPELQRTIADATNIDATTIIKQIKIMLESFAKANKDLSYRPLLLKSIKILKHSLSVETNQVIADNMKQLTAPNPIVILYGFAHMSESNDLDEMLEKSGKTVTIMLKTHSDQKLLAEHSQKSNAIFTGQDTPDYVYDISGNEMTKIETGKVSEQAYTSMLKYSITPEEYQAAFNELPDDLKPYALPYTEYDSDPDNNVVPDNWLETEYQYKP